MMKKILIFTDYFLPGNRGGGPITSISNLSRLICNHFQVTIVTRNVDFCETTPYSNVVHDELTQYGPYSVIYLSEISQKAVMSTIDRVKPDIIYLNSLFSIFTRLVLAYSFSNRIGAKIILAPRGELQKNALAMKRLKKLIYIFTLKAIKIQRGILFHATDKIELDRIKHIFPGSNVRTLPNVPRVIRESPREKDKNELRLIFISRIRNNKNLLYALETLSQCSCDVSFDIYGPIEDESYWHKCQSYIGSLRQNIKVAYKGAVASDLIPDTFRNYHALLLPTETENFGHVIVEAMQTGVVPIISNQTPWRNLEEFAAGWDIDLKRPELFSHAVTQLYEMDSLSYRALSKSTSNFIQKQLNLDDLEHAYISMFSEQF